MTFTNIFGGSTVFPADVSYRAIQISANTELDWPTEGVSDGNVVAQIMSVTPTTGGLSVRMPPANETSVGRAILFFNEGASSFSVSDNGGSTIVSLSPGQSWFIFITNNSTANGQWKSVQYGAGTSVATAGSLIGAGVKAIGSTLNQSMDVATLNVNYTAGSGDRSRVINWTGGAGTLSLTSASTVGSDWFIHVRNSGTGGLTISSLVGGQLVNGSASLVINPGDSAILFCDGSNFFTIGLGKSAAFAFDFVSIDLTGQPTPYFLTGSNVNRIAYRFVGTITGNVQIVVPSTVQQYWISNETSLASDPFTITVKTLTGTGVAVSRNQRSIMYSDGTNVIDADTAGIALPISVADGGTGATTASAARTNLGATSVGNAIFTAVSPAAARATLGSTVTGDALFVAATAADARTAIGATTVGGNLLTLSNPSAVRFLRVNADNTVSALSDADFRTAIGVSGSVTSVSGAGSVNGITLTGTVTSSGSLTLGGTLSGVDLATQTTGTLSVSRGGTGATTLTGILRGNGTSAFTAGNVNLSTEVTGQLARASLADGVALSVIGRSANSTGAVADISAASDGQVLRRSGTSLGFGAVDLSSANAVTGTLSVARGGTGATTLTGVVKGNGTSAFTAGTVSLTTEVSGTLPIANGGTNATTAAGARVNILPSLTGNAGRVLSVNGGETDVAWIPAGGSGTVTSVSGTGTVNGITLTGTVTASGSLTLGGTLSGVDLATQTTGTLSVSRGGTGATSLTGVLKGNGTSAFTAGTVSLTTEVSGTLPIGNGGTNATTASGARANILPTYTGNAGRVLAVNGTATDVEYVNVGTGTVTSVDVSGGTTGLTFSGGPVTTNGTITMAGTLAIANGGTGATTASGARTALGVTATGADTTYAFRSNNLSDLSNVATARTNLGATTVGDNIFTLTNPSAVTFLTINADNTVSARTASAFRGDIGATTVGNNLFTLTNPSAVTFLRINADNTVTARTASAFRGDIGATTVGGNIFTLTNPSAISFVRINADNTVTARSAADFRSDIGAAASGANTDITALDQDVTITATGTIGAETLGYRGIPVVSTTGKTLELSDQGKDIYTSGSITIPANSATAFPVGSVISITNSTASTVTISINTDTLRWNANTGTRTLAAYGTATIHKKTSTLWFIKGDVS